MSPLCRLLQAELSACNKRLEESRDESETLRGEVRKGIADRRGLEAEIKGLRNEVKELHIVAEDEAAARKAESNDASELRQQVEVELSEAR